MACLTDVLYDKSNYNLPKNKKFRLKSTHSGYNAREDTRKVKISEFVKFRNILTFLFLFL